MNPWMFRTLNAGSWSEQVLCTSPELEVACTDTENTGTTNLLSG